MARRLQALALAFVVAGAPLAGAICRVFCAEHPGNSPAGGPAGSHHQHAAYAKGEASHSHHPPVEAVRLSTGATVHAVTHLCRDGEPVVVESRKVVRAPLAKTLTATSGTLVVLVQKPAAAAIDCRLGPPGILHSIAPLRI